MPKRKTREELDAEMQVPREPAEQPAPDVVPVPARVPVPETAPEEPDPPQSVRLTGLIESLLLAAEDPIDLKTMLEVVRDLHSDMTPDRLKEEVDRLRVELREQGRGIRIGEVAGGYQLRTPTEAAPYIKKMVARRPPRLTRATLETLAIVAYRQPVTRGEVEDIRGVDSGAVLKHLLDKRLVKILGRKDEPGRPLLYGTTKEFLGFFSMKDLKSLPTLQDFAELSEEHRTALGLGPKQVEGEDEETRLAREDFLDVEETDAYAPVGEDEVINELSETLLELKQKNRELKKIRPKPKPETPPEQAAEGQIPPGVSQPSPSSALSVPGSRSEGESPPETPPPAAGGGDQKPPEGSGG
jgi:segregation and condensation protein B